VDLKRRIDELTRRPEVAEAIAFARERDAETLALQVELSEIPSPPFGEGARAARVGGLMCDAGLAGAAPDEVGNVVTLRPGTGAGGPLVVSAHLDTVFPAGTDVSVRREGDLYRGPGISDDARGLAALIVLARMLESSGIRTRRPLLFVATVGEEGAGDLRGVKRLFAEGGAGRGASGFVSLDGAGIERIVVDALGVRRYHVEIAGPGGHSWADWGLPNPIHLLARLGSRLTDLDLPLHPRSTLTIARVGGGKSINAIPQNAWMEIDTRSAGTDGLDRLESEIRAAAAGVVAGQEGVTVEVTIVGDRPAGRTDRDSLLVRAAVAATEALGGEPLLALSSTDANVPMALGIPALTLGCGGEAGKAHTTREWYRNVRGPDGLVRILHTVLLTAGMADGPV
jgi:tripeptide aminopeptidase